METLKQYRHMLWIVAFGIFYIAGFAWLERHVTSGFHMIHTTLDDRIPFCEYFVIPYFLWFAYIAAALIWFGVFGRNRREYYQLIINLGIGMTLFLVVSWIYPNGHNLRPTVFAHQNLFTDLVRYLYRIDTPTNILPSIHVYNSVAVAVAVESSTDFRRHRLVRLSSTILAVLIILSTMFLKQHSVTDVSLALALSLCSFVCLYLPEKAHQTGRAGRRPQRAKARIRHI